LNAQYPLEALVGRVLSPFEQFLRRTSAGGIVLVAATLATLVLAALVGSEYLHHLWERPAGFSLGSHTISLSLHHWVNDGLMALFFLLVGLELKREMLVGELASIRDAALPVVAAVGGMVVPACIYLAFTAGTPFTHGWGVPMATDIAFAVGILVLLGSRVPRNLIVFLTALAIVDDLGAVLVIALFYTAQIDTYALGAAGAITAVLVLFNRAGVRDPRPYWAVGAMLWLAVFASGVHATLAGIVLAMAIPARPSQTRAEFEQRLGELREEFHEDGLDATTADDPLRNARMTSIAEALERAAAAVQSPLQRTEHRLAPWVTFAVIPIFAIANAGIDLTAVRWSEALGSRITLGVIGGLVLGKFVGIGAFSWVAVKLGIGRLPSGVGWRHVFGAAWLGGIGFTMSIFIGQLAFEDALAVDQAKLGILLGSAIAAAIGLAWLWLSAARRAAK
jgi:NhaA family Na+:H+ antiporter